MSNKAPWMVALAIFITGVAVGALGMEALRMSHGWPFFRPEYRDMKTDVLERMSRELGLSAEQRQRVTPLLEEMMEQSRQARMPSLAAEQAILDTFDAKLREMLTPGQIRKHDEFLARMREHRGKMPFPPGGPPPLPPGGFPPMFGGPPPPDGPPPP